MGEATDEVWRLTQESKAAAVGAVGSAAPAALAGPRSVCVHSAQTWVLGPSGTAPTAEGQGQAALPSLHRPLKRLLEACLSKDAPLLSQGCFEGIPRLALEGPQRFSVCARALMSVPCEGPCLLLGRCS